MRITGCAWTCFALNAQSCHSLLAERCLPSHGHRRPAIHHADLQQTKAPSISQHQRSMGLVHSNEPHSHPQVPGGFLIHSAKLHSGDDRESFHEGHTRHGFAIIRTFVVWLFGEHML